MQLGNDITEWKQTNFKKDIG